MSEILLERVRKALAPRYDVQRELGSGGMGTVFLALDTTLERLVAIKILRPELATAAATERFLREARILAKLRRHPNVVPVYDADVADGLTYYVMDYIDGETLAERIRRGRMEEPEIVRLGSDVLNALKVVHDAGVIHRDVKPSNVFVMGDLALLADFGVAKPLAESEDSLTAPDYYQPGTPGYMPPEQLEGQSTPQTDICALGMVLYEAATGVRWSEVAREKPDVWRGVPKRLVPPLKRAVARSPADRWKSAQDFNAALLESRTGKSHNKRRMLTLASLGAALILLFIFWPPPPQPPVTTLRDLVILPVEIEGAWSEGWDGEGLARMVAQTLERAPNVSLVPRREAFAWWDSVSLVSGSGPELAADQLRARYAAHATLLASGEGTSLVLEVFDAAGRPVPGASADITFSRIDLLKAADSVSLRLLEVVVGEELSDIKELTSDVQAAIEFLQGERAFERGANVPAVQYYEAAVERDPGFALAWWHLANAWRWLGQEGPYDRDFQTLFEQYAAELGPVDSLLMAAQLTPAGEERLRLYRRAVDIAPLDYFANYLLGEELVNRGPLWGHPIEEAVNVLETVLDLNEYWALAYVHLIWSHIRLGNAEAALEAFGRLPEIAADPQEGWLYPPELMLLAYKERFEPDSAAEGLEALIEHPEFGLPENLVWLARIGGAFDIPRTQEALGSQLVASGGGAFRSAGHIARALGLVALGRGAEALADFDAAAAQMGDEARLLAAQWRVVPRALGIPIGSDLDLAEGVRRLELLALEESLRSRAAWGLALHARASGDLEAAERWAAAVRGTGDEPLTRFLDAMKAADGGDYEEALELSRPLLDIQAMAVPLRGGAVLGPRPQDDPLVRSALHLERGSWYERLGRLGRADREWLWYQAVDIDGLPTVGLPQPGEIDWALGNYGRWLRGRLALQQGQLETACRLFEHVVDLWADSDSTFADLVSEGQAGADRSCG